MPLSTLQWHGESSLTILEMTAVSSTSVISQSPIPLDPASAYKHVGDAIQRPSSLLFYGVQPLFTK